MTVTSKKNLHIPEIPDDFFIVKKTGISQAQAITAYLGGSAFQTVMDNPVTAYRQLVQQYAKDLEGKVISLVGGTAIVELSCCPA